MISTVRAGEILELMRPAVLVFDRIGTVVQTAHGFGSYAGERMEHFKGKHALELVIEEDRESLASVFIQARSATTPPLPNRFRSWLEPQRRMESSSRPTQ